MASAGSARKVTAPPTWRDEPSIHSDCASSTRDHRGMRRQAVRAGRFDRRAAQQCARFEGGAVRGELDQRARGARADDLDEAEAVDRGPLERLRQIGVEARVDRLRAALLPTVGKSMPIEPPMSSRRIALAAARRAICASLSGTSQPSTSIRVIAAVG